jgi:hypothetical protein
MNKHQVIWLIIRLAGVYFAFLTIVTFISLAGSVPALFTLPKIDVPAKNGTASPNDMSRPVTPVMSPAPYQPGYNPADPTTFQANPANNPNSAASKNDEAITDKFKGENFTNFIYFLAMTLVYAALTWYFLRDGRILFAILNREEPLGLKGSKEPEVTTLNLVAEKRVEMPVEVKDTTELTDVVTDYSGTN